MKDFGGRKVIVVGGTSGIGKMVAQLFLQRGGSALVVGRRDDRVAATVEELGHFGLVAGERADLTRCPTWTRCAPGSTPSMPMRTTW